MSDLKDDLISSLSSITKQWKQAKRQADRQDRISASRLELMRYRPQRYSIRGAAFDFMEQAYQKASGNGCYPANARQIYYAARPHILRATGETSLSSLYFIQTLLKDYMEWQQSSWDVVFDARGHFTEPHTEEQIGLGGIEVRDYIRAFTDGHIDETPETEARVKVPTKGPSLRYGAVLFIEKEGFGPLLKKAQIAEKYDLALASTKGMPVSALCDLLQKLKSRNITAYVVRDFDKAGFSIVSTLRKGARGSKGSGDIVDLGFRLKDIEGLQREDVEYHSDPRLNLKRNGATQEEIDILCRSNDYRDYSGERVELNAMTADEFVQWLERKLDEHVKKLIPDSKILTAAYRRAVFLRRIEEHIENIQNEISSDPIDIPGNLEKKIHKILKDEPELPWDRAVWRVAEQSD